jgi:hypothetical protein
MYVKEAVMKKLSILVLALAMLTLVVGVGAFAEARARAALRGHDLAFGRLPHPSPASPAANRGWDKLADAAFLALGLLPGHGVAH